MVSWMSIAWAIATLVPTPSVEVASTGMAHRGQPAGVEQPGEAAEAGQHLRAPGGLDPVPHQVDGPLPRRDVDSGGGVRARLLASRAQASHPPLA